MQLAAITDEFSPDLETAVRAMAEIGLTGAELRVVFGKNILDLTDAELDRACEIVAANGLQIISIASPLLKCVLPNAPDVDHRFQQDVFASQHTFADQPRLADRAFAIAERTGARILRVFSYWRTVQPEACFDRVVRALEDLARAGPVIALENEHACNLATAAECAAVLQAVSQANLQLVWDPANAYVSGETPYPDGYHRLPAGRIAHVHAKDCRMENGRPVWLQLGDGAIDWPGQIRALAADGYAGYVSLETHWPGPHGDKLAGSIMCGRRLRQFVADDGACAGRNPQPDIVG